MESLKTSNSQNNLEKNNERPKQIQMLEESHDLKYTTKVQWLK